MAGNGFSYAVSTLVSTEYKYENGHLYKYL